MDDQKPWQKSLQALVGDLPRLAFNEKLVSAFEGYLAKPEPPKVLGQELDAVLVVADHASRLAEKYGYPILANHALIVRTRAEDLQFQLSRLGFVKPPAQGLLRA